MEPLESKDSTDQSPAFTEAHTDISGTIQNLKTPLQKIIFE